MDFKLSKEQLMLQKMYREFAENEVKPIAADVAEKTIPADDNHSRNSKVCRDYVPGRKGSKHWRNSKNKPVRSNS